MASARYAACTICSKNYLHFARTLMASVAEQHPDWDRFVLLVDKLDGEFDPAAEDFEVIEVLELPIPDPHAFCFRYTILELNTAAKPWLLDWLFEERAYERVIYLDPDIRLYRPLADVVDRLESGSFAVLTPHLTGPIDNEHNPGEIEILRAGSYNLGFLALARHPELRPFLDWWESHLERECIVDMDRGLFVDQKWIDLVPGRFDDVSILRHEGYNVAYWNLPHRQVVATGSGHTVNGYPLVFFHFSGLNPSRPRTFSKYQNRYLLEDLGPVQDLVLAYCEEVASRGLDECSRWPYAFARLADGTLIPDFLRRYAIRHPDFEKTASPNPFQKTAAHFNQPWGEGASGDPMVTTVARSLWESLPTIQGAFPAPEGHDRVRFAEWFVHGREIELDDAWVEPMKASLNRHHQRHGSAMRIPVGFVTAGRRFAKRVLPASIKGWLRSLSHAPSRRDGWTIRAVRAMGRLLPGSLKHRVKAMINPVSAPPRSGPAPVELRASVVAKPHRIVHVGFHAVDSSYPAEAWMGEVATIRIPGTARGTLCVAGTYEPEHLVRAGGSATTALEVLVDGDSTGVAHLRDQGPFVSVFELAGGNGHRISTIELRSNQTFVPSEIGESADHRRFSFRVARVTLRDEALVDFSNPKAALPRPNEGTPGMNIIGYLRAELGIGESGRLCAAAAELADVPVALIEFRQGCGNRADDDRLVGRLRTDNPHTHNVFHINADQLTVAYDVLGAEFFRNRFNIGYWHWELPEFPDEWVKSFSLVDEVWVPSRFCLESIGAKSPVPVVRIPHPIRFDEPQIVSRAKFGLPENRFLFLTMWDMNSIRQRKNPEGALEAFRRAFPDGEGVGLVIKTMNTHAHEAEWRWLEAKLHEVPGVIVLNDTISRQEVYELEAACDASLSLHRSEGFGLGLAECMYMGKPVIGTNWSGNADFMNHDNSCPVRYRLVELEEDYGPYQKGQHWAEPDLDDAAHWMRKLVDDVPFRERIAASGRETIRTEYSPTTIGRRYRERLEAIERWR